MLALSILVSMTSGLVLVSADDTASALNTILSFDFNGDNYTAFRDYCLAYTGNSSLGGTQQTDSATYGIDGYDRHTSGLYIPLGTETDADGHIIGVKRTGVNNLYIEAVLKLTKSGVINGADNNSFLPKGLATRAEAVKMLYEAYRLK